MVDEEEPGGIFSVWPCRREPPLLADCLHVSLAALWRMQVWRRQDGVFLEDSAAAGVCVSGCAVYGHQDPEGAPAQSLSGRAALPGTHTPR